MLRDQRRDPAPQQRVAAAGDSSFLPVLRDGPRGLIEVQIMVEERYAGVDASAPGCRRRTPERFGGRAAALLDGHDHGVGAGEALDVTCRW